MQTRLLFAGFSPWSADRHFYTFLLLLGSISTALAQTPTIRYVKAGGTGNGSAWTNASGDLQAMINASTSGDQVWVATGTYNPTSTSNRTISFAIKNGVAIYGGFVGTETTLNQRVLTRPLSTTRSGELGDPATTADESPAFVQPVDPASPIRYTAQSSAGANLGLGQVHPFTVGLVAGQLHPPPH